MNKTIACFWAKHEGWAAPLAMFFFLVTGIQMGAWITTAKLTTQHVAEIKELQDKITDKDNRLRSFNDTQRGDQKSLVDALSGATNSAAKSAEAATKAADAAAKAADSANKP